MPTNIQEEEQRVALVALSGAIKDALSSSGSCLHFVDELRHSFGLPNIREFRMILPLFSSHLGGAKGPHSGYSPAQSEEAWERLSAEQRSELEQKYAIELDEACKRFPAVFN